MTLPIAVEFVSGSAPPAELAGVLVEACSRATDGGCVLLGDARDPGEIRALAVVSAEGDGYRRIQVRVARMGPRQAWLRSRDIVFRDDDPAVERFRSAGLAVAALDAGDVERDGLLEPVPAATKPLEPPRPSFVGVGAFLGEGLEGGPLRAGTSATIGFAGLPEPMLVTAGASYSATVIEGAHHLSARWVTVAIGGGLGVRVRALGAVLQPRWEAFAEHLFLSAHADDVAGDASAHAWGAGVRAGLDLVWPCDSPVAIAVGPEGFLRMRPTVLQFRGQPEAAVAQGGYSVGFGLRWRVP